MMKSAETTISERLAAKARLLRVREKHVERAIQIAWGVAIERNKTMRSELLAEAEKETGLPAELIDFDDDGGLVEADQ